MCSYLSSLARREVDFGRRAASDCGPWSSRLPSSPPGAICEVAGFDLISCIRATERHQCCSHIHDHQRWMSGRHARCSDGIPSGIVPSDTYMDSTTEATSCLAYDASGSHEDLRKGQDRCEDVATTTGLQEGTGAWFSKPSRASVPEILSRWRRASGRIRRVLYPIATTPPSPAVCFDSGRPERVQQQVPCDMPSSREHLGDCLWRPRVLTRAAQASLPRASLLQVV